MHSCPARARVQWPIGRRLAAPRSRRGAALRRLRLHAGNFGAQLRQFPDDTCQILVQVVEVRLLVGSGTRRAGCGRSRWRGEGGPSECGGGRRASSRRGTAAGARRGRAGQCGACRCGIGATCRAPSPRSRRESNEAFALSRLRCKLLRRAAFASQSAAACGDRRLLVRARDEGHRRFRLREKVVAGHVSPPSDPSHQCDERTKERSDSEDGKDGLVPSRLAVTGR